MSSTQRSESANHMLKRFVPRNCSMNRFIVQFNKLLFDRNSVEDRAEFDTNIFNNVRDRAWPLEENAMKFYTAAAYELFRKEINKSTYYFARVKSENNEFEVIHVKPHKKLPWGRDSFTVTVVNEGERYDCECGLYDHFGMLCSHVLRVLVQLGVYEIPKAHIHKRWTQFGEGPASRRLKAYQKDTLCMQSMTYRHSYLYVNALDLVVEGNKDLGAFDIVAKDIKKIQRKLRAYFEAKEKLAANGVGKGMLTAGNYYPSESDIGADSGYETEGRICNTYGAAGSSACMSDSELLKIRAPAFSRPSGRPKEIRFKGTQDYYGKKQKRKRNTDMDNRDAEPNSLDSGKKKKLPRCGDCEILGHTATQCKKINVDVNSELPEF